MAKSFLSLQCTGLILIVPGVMATVVDHCHQDDRTGKPWKIDSTAQFAKFSVSKVFQGVMTLLVYPTQVLITSMCHRWNDIIQAVQLSTFTLFVLQLFWSVVLIGVVSEQPRLACNAPAC